MDIVKGGIVLLELGNWVKSRLIPGKRKYQRFCNGTFYE